MKISIKKTDLLKVIQIVQNMISPRTSMPILSYFLLNAKDGRIKISATDLDIGVICTVAAEVHSPGIFTLPGKTFSEIIRFAPGDDILMEADGETIDIKSGKSRFKINSLAHGEFPIIPEGDRDVSFKLSRKDIKDIVRKTLFAVSREESRYALNGVLLSASSEGLTAVATDARRLSLVKKQISGIEAAKTAILPSKAMSELNKIVDGVEGDVEVCMGDNEIIFRAKDVILMARLIKGDFVDYERIIPRDYNIRLSICKETFLSVLKRVSILTNDSFRVVKITLNDNKMFLSANTEIGESSDEIDIDYAGEELALAFNPDCLVDYLQNETAEELFFDIVNPKSPVVFRPSEDGGCLYITTPLKLQ